MIDEDLLDRGVTILGHPSDVDVFVTGADGVAGMSSAQIAERLSLFDATGSLRKDPFAVLEFTPHQASHRPSIGRILASLVEDRLRAAHASSSFRI